MKRHRISWLYVTTNCLRVQEGVTSRDSLLRRPLGFEARRPLGFEGGDLWDLRLREGDLWGIATSCAVLWGNLWGIVGAGHGTSELILRAHFEKGVFE